jgi:hypothetical protein
MKWVVRSEADGYLGEDASDVVNQPKDEGTALSPEHPVALANLSPASQLLCSDELTVMRKGFVVSPESIIEVKCGSMKTKGKNKIQNKIAQCWFSQTQHMFIGCHEEGSVLEVNKLDMKSELEKWEETHQANLKKLMYLITKTKELVTAVEGKRCCLVYDGKQKPALIKLMKSNHDGLSLSVQEKFWADKPGEKSDT